MSQAWTDAGRRRQVEPDGLGPLSRKSVAQVRADLKAFKPRYKQDWRDWMNTLASHPLVAPETVAQCRRVLAKWQAVRSKMRPPCQRRSPRDTGRFEAAPRLHCVLP